MAVVSIYEGNVEHRFDVPAGYRPVVRSGHGELVIDPDYQPSHEALVGADSKAQIGKRAAVLELDMGGIGEELTR